MLKQILVALSLLMAGDAFARTSDMTLKPGDYIEDGFIKTLKSTYSPVAALNEEGHLPQSIHVSQNNESLEFLANDNWHERYVLFTLHKDGQLEKGQEDVMYPKPKVDSPTHFLFRESQPSTWRGYTYVGDANAEIVRIVLAGKYTDNKKRFYEFGANGVLHGLGEDTGYSLNNDHIGNCNFDYFDFKDTIIAFKRTKEKLYLYTVKPPESAPDCEGSPNFSHPLRVLQLIK